MAIKTDKLKLVIWDLDNTLWDGVLAEKDDVNLRNDVSMVIVSLILHGVMVSICSKNDYNEAKEKLEKLGIWQYFLFPSINFEPKGPRIKQIIENMNLRAENVLFVDDTIDNLVEAEFYNPEISTLHAPAARELLNHPSCKGKEDIQFTRLMQYKALEQKQTVKAQVSDNEEFLRSIHIKVQMIDYLPRYFDRIYDLVHRTNQLNFTKNRMDKEELQQLLEDPSVEKKCIRVIDDFSDNGIIGFYAIKDGKLVHYIFSCRIINMGVEQWVYTYIGEPELEVVGKVAGKVEKGVPLCDYITKIGIWACEYKPEQLLTSYMQEDKKMKVYALGACDMYRMIGDLATPNADLVFECNTFRGVNRGVNVGTEYIRSCFDMNEEEKEFCKLHFMNYKGERVFQSKIFAGDYDYCIFTFHDEFSYVIYESKTNPNLRILRNCEGVCDDNGVVMMYKPQFDWLTENFEEPHFITTERFAENLAWIRERIPMKTKMILVNAATFEEDVFPRTHEEIMRLNPVIEAFASDPKNNAVMIDVDRFVTKREDFTDYLFHWSTQVSYQVTLECMKEMAKAPSRMDRSLIEGLPWGDRKLVLYGKDHFTHLAYYSLMANGLDLEGIYHHEPENGAEILPATLLDGKKEDTFVIITQSETSPECIEVLKGYGYEEIKDYIVYQPGNYISHWFEHA